jgi:hypothetical protein
MLTFAPAADITQAVEHLPKVLMFREHAQPKWRISAVSDHGEQHAPHTDFEHLSTFQDGKVLRFRSYARARRR